MKIHSIFLFAALLALSACGGTAPAEPAGTAREIADTILQSQRDMPPLEPLTPDSEAFASYISGLYNIDPGVLEDGAIYYAGGMEASEIAVLAFSSEEEAREAEAALSDYLISRADSFTGYVPEQAALVENSTAAVRGRYAALLICPDPEAAETAFSACFAADWAPPPKDTGAAAPRITEDAPPESSPSPEDIPEMAELPEPQPPAGTPEKPANAPDAAEPSERGTPPAEPSPPASEEAVPSEPEPSPAVSDEYDREAVLSAWRSGDSSGLGEKSRMVFDAASAALAQVITQDMTDYQRELAVHDYITGHGRYDPEASSNAPGASPDPDNDNPYGMLVNGVGICRGYASTFQLLMDMLGIECMTVEGNSGRREHAWNMVRLDGDWYCVDVTWDDPSGGQPGHRYFNVTSQFLRETSHQWDAGVVPEASAVLWAYQG